MFTTHIHEATQLFNTIKKNTQLNKKKLLTKKIKQPFQNQIKS